MCAKTPLAILLIVAVCGCSGGGSGGAIQPGPSTLGQAIEGLPAEQQAAFDRGRALVERQFKPSEGLGPFYNADSCVACHSTPVTGGSSPIYRNFYLVAQGIPAAQTPVVTPAGPLPSIVMPSYATIDGPRPTIPPSLPPLFPITVAQRNAPPMFGVGLFEFVSDQTILANSDPDDGDGDGISGRINRTNGANLNVGRFGYKSQANNIEVFIRGAARNQMGMTTDPVLGDGALVTMGDGCMRPLTQVGGTQNQPLTDNDAVGDPEISTQDFGDIIAYSRFLAPPVAKPFSPAALRGQAQFAAIGCTRCHLPSLASSVGPLAAYTDLLIHDMGPVLADGIALGNPEPSAISPNHTGSEFRTQPLWGVSMSGPFLHDGRAQTLLEAIILHDGEGQISRQSFEGLSQADQSDIIDFLEAL